MKKETSKISLVIQVVVLSLFTGGLLSLIIGYRNGEFLLIPPIITILDSLLLGIAILLSLFFLGSMNFHKQRELWVYFLAFAIMLGAGALSALLVFFFSPASFFYSDNRTITYLLVNLLFFITINMILNAHRLFLKRQQEQEQALSSEKLLKSQMELQLLSSKINPHFLFNSLSLILSLLEQPNQAERAILHLAQLLRYQLDCAQAERVSLKMELEAAEKYLSIQQMRFGEKLSYHIDPCKEVGVPPLLIQPLIENSIKHNIATCAHLHVGIKIRQNETQTQIHVLDSEAKLSPAMLDQGVGLAVTKKRIELFGGKLTLAEGGILITFPHD